VLYIASATPLPLKSYTSSAVGSPPPRGVYTSWSFPGPGATKSVARYWSPNAWRPMTMGLTHPGTGRGMRSRTIGSRKTVPPRMLRICACACERRRANVSERVARCPMPDASPEWGRGLELARKRGGKGKGAEKSRVYVRCHWENATSV
jgi:hypothetical protein